MNSPSSEIGSLHSRCNCVPAVPVLLLASLVLVGLGLWLPALETKKLVVSVSSYSILSGVGSLYRNGHWPTATLVAAFSILFPAVKLLGLAGTWFLPLHPDRRARAVRILEALGKWSMLDVFVVTILMGNLNLGFPSGAQTQSGVYVFGSGILLSMLCARMVAHEAGSDRDLREARSGKQALPGLVVGAGALACYAVGVKQMLMHTSKWHFWDTDYSILAGADQLLESARVLGYGLILFVVLVPLVLLVWGMAGLVAGMLGRRLAARWTRLFRWSMGDVFALSIVVVVTKLKDVFEITYGPGLAYFLCGIVLFWIFPYAASKSREGGDQNMPS